MARNASPFGGTALQIIQQHRCKFRCLLPQLGHGHCLQPLAEQQRTKYIKSSVGLTPCTIFTIGWHATA
jgi:hypothetical protein